ncbi:MAG TPA: DUF1360 domain-containing protein [Kofleriaceae bacterium]|jgi:hypothetical protein
MQQHTIDTPRGLVARYSPTEATPLAAHATLMTIWAAGMTTFLATCADRLPKQIPWRDLALMSIATHKLARIATKDRVTSPLRAPFVRYQKSTGSGEVAERARGHGMQRAIGELVTCPLCIAPWIAGALGIGFVLAPRVTRFVAGVFAAVAVSDSLQHIYAAEKKL